MIFTLEALQAKHGDALLLHYGEPDEPRLIVIDGGPAGIYRSVLRGRLQQLRASRAADPDTRLPVRMVMVSHIDDDHINGILALTRALVRLQETGANLPYQIATLWHNSFDDLLGNEEDELSAALEAAVRPASSGDVTTDLPIRREAALVLASVKQGRDLRNDAIKLSLDRNDSFPGLVLAPVAGVREVALGDGLSFVILGPREQRVRELQAEWNTQIKKMGVARAAEFVDNSVFNLASIIVLAKMDGRTMLLTGDARGDDILAGLMAAELLPGGTMHVDLLKLPHHGSDRNVSTEFFRQVTADHYVVSGDGQHSNPEIATLHMLSAARGQSEFTLHLTNREPRLHDFFTAERAQGKRYHVVFRQDDAASVRVPLGLDPGP